MYCISCGVVLPDNGKFCPSCGTGVGQYNQGKSQANTAVPSVENIPQKEPVSELDKLTANVGTTNSFANNSDNNLFGALLFILGAGASFYGIIRMNSSAVQLANAIGMKDNTGPMCLLVGIIVAIIGIAMLFSKNTNNSSNK